MDAADPALIFTPVVINGATVVEIFVSLREILAVLFQPAQVQRGSSGEQSHAVKSGGESGR